MILGRKCLWRPQRSQPHQPGAWARRLCHLLHRLFSSVGVELCIQQSHKWIKVTCIKRGQQQGLGCGLRFTAMPRCTSPAETQCLEGHFTDLFLPSECSALSTCSESQGDWYYSWIVSEPLIFWVTGNLTKW